MLTHESLEASILVKAHLNIVLYELIFQSIKRVKEQDTLWMVRVHAVGNEHIVTHMHHAMMAPFVQPAQHMCTCWHIVTQQGRSAYFNL